MTEEQSNEVLESWDTLSSWLGVIFDNTCEIETFESIFELLMQNEGRLMALKESSCISAARSRCSKAWTSLRPIGARSPT